MLSEAAQKKGIKFIDAGLTSQPRHYCVHIINEVNEDNIIAKHVASGSDRTFSRTDTGLKNLNPITSIPDVQSNLDCLVGEKVRVALSFGATITGTVTAIFYKVILLDGEELNQVSDIEIDRSGSTRYAWSEVESIQTI